MSSQFNQLLLLVNSPRHNPPDSDKLCHYLAYYFRWFTLRSERLIYY